MGDTRTRHKKVVDRDVPSASAASAASSRRGVGRPGRPLAALLGPGRGGRRSLALGRGGGRRPLALGRRRRRRRPLLQPELDVLGPRAVRGDEGRVVERVAVVARGQAQDGLDARDDVAALVGARRQVRRLHAHAAQEGVDGAQGVRAAAGGDAADEVVERAGQVEGGVADVDVDEQARRRQAHAGKEAAHGGEAGAERGGAHAGADEGKGLVGAQGDERGVRLGAVAAHNVEGVDQRQGAVVGGAGRGGRRRGSRRRQEVAHLVRLERVRVPQAHGVLRPRPVPFGGVGILQHVRAVRHHDIRLVARQPRARHQRRLVVREHVPADRRQRGRLVHRQPHNLHQLAARRGRRHRHGVAVQHQLRRHVELDVVGPQHDGRALAAVAGARRERGRGVDLDLALGRHDGVLGGGNPGVGRRGRPGRDGGGAAAGMSAATAAASAASLASTRPKRKGGTVAATGRSSATRASATRASATGASATSSLALCAAPRRHGNGWSTRRVLSATGCCRRRGVCCGCDIWAGLLGCLLFVACWLFVFVGLFAAFLFGCQVGCGVHDVAEPHRRLPLLLLVLLPDEANPAP